MKYKFMLSSPWLREKPSKPKTLGPEPVPVRLCDARV